MRNNRPEDYEIISPSGFYKATVHFGDKKSSVVTSGYGDPYYPTEITVTTIKTPDKKLFVWRKDSEGTEVKFSDDSRYLEILWEISGCIYGSSGTRYFRDLFQIPNGVSIVHSSSDFSRNKETFSNPNQFENKTSVDLPSQNEFTFRDFVIIIISLAIAYYLIPLILRL